MQLPLSGLYVRIEKGGFVNKIDWAHAERTDNENNVHHTLLLDNGCFREATAASTHTSIVILCKQPSSLKLCDPAFSSRDQLFILFYSRNLQSVAANFQGFERASKYIFFPGFVVPKALRHSVTGSHFQVYSNFSVRNT